MTYKPLLGAALILLTISFNLPYGLLAASFDYPDILRRPAGEVLARFAAGGDRLIAVWYAYGAAAMLLIGLAAAFGFHAGKAGHPGARTTAVFGMLAGLTQAIGLLRWAFVVPMLARLHQAPEATEATRQTAELLYELVNRYGGAAIGEHLGQLLTTIWMFGLGWGQLYASQPMRLAGLVAILASALIGVGCINGIASIFIRPLAMLDLATTAGFLLLSLWLLITGIAMLRQPGPHQRA